MIRYGPEETNGHDGARAYDSAVRDLTRLNQLLSLLADDAPLPGLVERLVLTLSELFAAEVVVLLDSPARRLTCLGAIGLPESERAPTFASGDDAYPALVARERAPIVVDDARGDPRTDPLLRTLEVEAAVWLPVIGSQQVQAVLLLARCQKLPFGRHDADLLMAAANRVGLMLERARTDEERRRVELRLRQAEKAESLGRMAGAIAHRFNNLFSVVIGNLELALGELPDGATRQEVLAALQATRQAAGISGSMLTYLGHGRHRREAIDLVATCRSTLSALAASLPTGVRLLTDLPVEAVPVRASADAVGQVLTNLVVNAWEAMGVRGGAIAVSLRVVTADQIDPGTYPMHGWTPREGTYASLEVRDTGLGMTPAELEDAFDPFFSTKFPGRGLGLPVVLGVVRAHDGLVTLDSERGRGTTVSVFLPTLSSAADQPHVAAPAEALGSGLALVADDEPLARKVLERMLAKLGFGVMAVADGVAALEAFAAHRGEVRFAILDAAMPRLGGWETLQALREVAPELPVIVTSGHDELSVMRGGGQPPQAFLQKPFGSSELAAAIERALAPVKN